MQADPGDESTAPGGVEPEGEGVPPAGADAEGYRYGWKAGLRGQLALQTWDEMQPALQADWTAYHAALGCAQAHAWEQATASAQLGWDAARRTLQASL